MIAGSYDDNERKEVERLERLSRVKSLYVRGIPLFKIAEEFNCSTVQIRKDIELLKRHLLKSAQRMAKHLLTTELAKLDEVEFEAWEQWTKSKNDRVVKTTIKKQQYIAEAGKTVDLEEERITVEPQAGDPRYLDIILKNAAHRAKLLKLDQPESGGQEQPHIVQVIVDSPEQVARIMHYNEFDKLTVTGAASQVQPEG